MQRSQTKAYEFKGSKGPNIIWLILTGAVVVGAFYLLLMLATKLSALPNNFFETGLFFGVIVAFLAAIIMKWVRDWSFWGTYFCIMIAIVLLTLLVSNISKSLPLKSDDFDTATRILIGVYGAYVIAMITMKIVTRRRLVISSDGEMQAYHKNTPSCRINLREYQNRVECTYSRLNFHSGNAVETYIDIGVYSFTQFKAIRALVEQYAGEYVNTVQERIDDEAFFPEGWKERVKADADFRDELYQLVIKTHEWAIYPELREAMETLATYGQVKAMYAIGMHYFGDKTIKKDYREGPKLDGLNWLRNAAKHGSTKAAYELGDYYDTHWNKGYSPSTAADYYKQAMNDPSLKKMAELGLNVARGRMQEQSQARASYTGGSGGATRTKSEIDLQMALTAVNYDAQADVLMNNDNLTDEQKAQALGMLAGFEINELLDLRKEKKSAKDG